MSKRNNNLKYCINLKYCLHNGFKGSNLRSKGAPNSKAIMKHLHELRFHLTKVGKHIEYFSISYLESPLLKNT